GHGRLLAALAHTLGREAGLVGRARAHGGGPAVYLRQQAPVGQGLEVAADGHVGDAVFRGELADPDAAGGPDTVENRGLPLLREHQRTAAGNRTNSNTPEHYLVSGRDG